MAVVALLLLSLLTTQTVRGGGFHDPTFFRRAQDSLVSELTEWEPERFARDQNAVQAELENWKSTEVRRTEGNVAGCGVPAIAPSVSVRIVGGVEAVPHSWPWMVSMQFDGNHFCGGSLINNQWFVSAAHCAQGFKMGSNQSMVVGMHRKSQPDRYTVRVPVSNFFINHKYNRPGRDRTSDIMLVKLAHPVELNDAVSPVCLPSQFQRLPAGKRCYSSGWGTLSGGGSSPDELMQVMLPLIDNEVCNQRGWYNSVVDDSMVCAGFEEGGRGNCNGDSGGPLVCLDGDRWVLYGAVSWGSRRCAESNKPTVYAWVSAYVKWINETISTN